MHFDNITMHLLPLPGFTIQNFVVQEDPAFGAEPAMRANVVEARVRFSSLWRRRVEISRIRLEAPSVNLVRRTDGVWNLQGVVAQAGQLQSAPTAQTGAGQAPRFPYIEATGARVNLKLGDDKLPYSLVDAKFALWLPTAQEWHLRLQGRPLRTDTDVSDVGELRLEGTLGRGSGRGAANEPLTLDLSWKPTPMGEAGKLITGADGGWRGEASAELSLHGSAAVMTMVSDVHMHDLRRADFVPQQTMSVDAHCEAEAKGVLHQLHQVRCVMPTAQSTSLLDAVNFFRARKESAADAPDVLTMEAEVPNALDWRSATVLMGLQKGSPEWVLGWLRLFSTRIAPGLKVGGDLSARLDYQPEGPGDRWSGDVVCRCVLPPLLKVSLSDKMSAPASAPVKADAGVWALNLSHLPSPDGPQNVVSVKASHIDSPVASNVNTTAAPTPRAEEALLQQSTPPASTSVLPALISGQLSRSGYTLQFASAGVARYAAGLLPALGDWMPANLNTGAQSQRTWGGVQTWTAEPAAASHAVRRGGRHRR